MKNPSVVRLIPPGFTCDNSALNVLDWIPVPIKNLNLILSFTYTSSFTLCLKVICLIFCQGSLMTEQYLKQVQHNLLKVSVHVQYIIQSSLTQNYRYSSAFSACIVQS